MENILKGKIFVLVWFALIILTGATIIISYLELNILSIVIPIGIASLKAYFVIFYFMHLKYEKKLFKIILMVGFVTITVIIGFTFLDVLYRK